MRGIWRPENWGEIKLKFYDMYKPLSGNITLAEANDNMFETGADAMYGAALSKVPTPEGLKDELYNLMTDLPVIKSTCKFVDDIDFDTLKEKLTELFQRYALPPKELPVKRATIVCLCGSTRFGEAFRLAEFEETLKGRIVLTIGCNMKSDNDLFGDVTEAERESIKKRLDELHLQKIDLADEVKILNVGGYIGESTRNELNYAISQGKKVVYLESPA